MSQFVKNNGVQKGYGEKDECERVVYEKFE
jgi:hypothetical protein